MLDRLADGSELSAKSLREQLPELEGRIDLAVGKAYGANVAISPRVLTQLGVEGLVTRGRNGGHWRVSRPQWTSMAAWLGDVPEPALEIDALTAATVGGAAGTAAAGDRPATEPDADPVGDADLLGDLGVPAAKLLALCSHEGMLPADVTSEVCQAIGCGDELEELREV